MADRHYAAVESRSPVGLVLTAALLPLSLKNTAGERLSPFDRLDAFWGKDPDMSRRHRVSKGPPGVLLLTDVLLLIVAIATYIVGDRSQVSAVQHAALVPAFLGLLAGGLSVPL